MPEHDIAPLGEIHRVANWEYANAAARTAATGFLVADVGKWAKQTDDGSYWELTDESPITWAQRTGPAPAVINPQTGTTYTLLASDLGKVITLSNASAITVTVPSGLGEGFNCMCIQKGAGQVTFSPSGTTVNNRQGHTKTAGQHAVASLVADVANNFYLGGDTAA
jgi:hypothetical protein